MSCKGLKKSTSANGVTMACPAHDFGRIQVGRLVHQVVRVLPHCTSDAGYASSIDRQVTCR